MNIFILDYNLEKCARFHCDKHVVKMLTEAAQILCTVANLTGMKTAYKSTHILHPCILWAQQNRANWLWLWKLARALNNEYRYRYEKNCDHAGFSAIASLEIPKLPLGSRTGFVKVMPDEFKRHVDVVEAYRAYYVNCKKKFAAWTKRKTPKWFQTC